MAVAGSDDFQRHVSALVVALDIYPEIMKTMISNTYPSKLVENMLHGEVGQTFVGTLTPKQQRLVEGISKYGYKKLDIELMYKLIKYFGLVEKPSKNWGKQPGSNDISQGDDIERMRHNRNDVVHRARLSLDEKEFDDFFEQSMKIAMRIDTVLGRPSNIFQTIIEKEKNRHWSFEDGSKYLSTCPENQGIMPVNDLRQINFYVANDIKYSIENDDDDVPCTIYVRDPEMNNTAKVVEVLQKVIDKINKNNYKITVQAIEEGSLMIHATLSQGLKEMECLKKEVILLFKCIFEYIDKHCGPRIDVVLAESDYTFMADRSNDVDQGTSELDFSPTKMLKMNVTVHKSSFQSVKTLSGEVHGFLSSILNSVDMGTSHGNRSCMDVIMTENYKETVPPDMPVGPIKFTNILETSVTLEWSSPINNGGPPVTGYTLEITNDSKTWTEVARCDEHATKTEVKCLKTGTTYKFRVFANNMIGKSKPLESKEVTTSKPKVVPDMPVGPIKCTNVLETSVTLEWSPPRNNGGSHVTGYTIESTSDSKNWIEVARCDKHTTKTEVKYLNAGTTYKFRVLAINMIGISKPLESVEVTTTEKPEDVRQRPKKRPPSPVDQDFQEDVKAWKKIRTETIPRLNRLKSELDSANESVKSARRFRNAAIFTSFLAGVVFAPFTAGSSLLAAAAVSGGATGVTFIIETIIEKGVLDATQEGIDKDKAETLRLRTRITSYQGGHTRTEEFVRDLGDISLEAIISLARQPLVQFLSSFIDTNSMSLLLAIAEVNSYILKLEKELQQVEEVERRYV